MKALSTVDFSPSRSRLAAIDSDGCVFDTMELKQKRFFHPLIVRFWNLQPVEAQVRQAAEFVNLYSRWRGRNRFESLLRVFRLLPDVPGVREAGVVLPETEPLAAYVSSGLPLGHPSLRRAVERGGDPELKRVLAWSRAVNRAIDAHMPPAAPFSWARKSLVKLSDVADMIVVSQTPRAALLKEWRMHGLDRWVKAIAGQESGPKSHCLRLVSEGRYERGNVLMIGDAPADRLAAREADALFYPIWPGREEESWRHFHDETLERLVSGTYDAACQAARTAVFDALLPAEPPWVSGGAS